MLIRTQIAGAVLIVFLLVTGHAAAAVQTYPIPTADSRPLGIAVGPDGNVWFTEHNASKVARITPGGTVTEFPLAAGRSPRGIVAGPDGNLWFAEEGFGIGKLSPQGELLAEYTTGVDGVTASGIARGPDGNLWFTEPQASFSAIGRITPGGEVTNFPGGVTTSSGPLGITAGPDGNLWFTEHSRPAVGRITPQGTVTEFTQGISETAAPQDIVSGHDGRLWFTQSGNGRIGRITTSGVIDHLDVGALGYPQPVGITAGPGGVMYFTDASTGAIARVGEGDEVEPVADLGPSAGPVDLAVGPGNRLWVANADGNSITRVDLAPVEATPTATPTTSPQAGAAPTTSPQASPTTSAGAQPTPTPEPQAPPVASISIPAPPAVRLGEPLTLLPRLSGPVRAISYEIGKETVVCGAGEPRLTFIPNRRQTLEVMATPIGAGGTPGRSELVSAAVSASNVPFVGSVPGVRKTAEAYQCGPADALVLSECEPGTVQVGVMKLRASGDGCVRYLPRATAAAIPEAERALLRVPNGDPGSVLSPGAYRKLLAMFSAYVIEGPVRLNGVDITPRGDARLVLVPDLNSMGASAATVRVGPIKIHEGSLLTALSEDAGRPIHLGSFAPLESVGLGALPVRGKVDVTLDRPGEALIEPRVELPEPFGFFGAHRIVKVSARADIDGGLALEELEIGPVDVPLGFTEIEDLVLHYSNAQGQQAWVGGGEMEILGYGIDMKQETGHGVAIERGRLKYIRAKADLGEIGHPLGNGLFLHAIDIGASFLPTVLHGGADFSYAQLVAFGGGAAVAFASSAEGHRYYPQPEHLNVKRLPGRLADIVARMRRENDPLTSFSIATAGTVGLRLPYVGTVDLKGSGAYGLYAHGRFLTAGGGIDEEIPDVVSLRGTMDGDVNLDSGRFNFHGNGRVCVADIVCSGGVMNVSGSGMGGCIENPLTTQGGGVTFKPFKFYFWPFDGCRWSAFAQDVKLRQAASNGGPVTMTFERGDRPQAVELTGATAPRVVVTAPDGERLESPAGAGLAGGEHMSIARSEVHETTWVTVQTPQMGRYTVEPLPGSAAIDKVARATDPAPAKVSGTLEGADVERVLRYRITPQPGVRVRFLEVTSSGEHIIGEVDAGSGSLRFASTPGEGDRHIDAQIVREGLNAERSRVLSFEPANAQLGAVRRLRVERRGTRTAARWAAVPHADRYLVALTLSDGRQRRLESRAARVSLGAVPKSESATVTVHAIAGERSGKAATVRLKATRKAVTRLRAFPPRRAG